MNMIEKITVTGIIGGSLLIGALMCSGKAHAGGTVLCFNSGSTIACSVRLGTNNFGQNLNWPKVSPEQREAWRARCKPAEHTDQYGVTRMQYAVKGCEYGP